MQHVSNGRRLPSILGALMITVGLVVLGGGSAAAGDKPTPVIDASADHTITQGQTLTVRVFVHPAASSNGSGTGGSTTSSSKTPTTTASSTTTLTTPTTAPITTTTPTTRTTATTPTSQTTTTTTSTSESTETTETTATTPTADTAVNGATGVPGLTDETTPTTDTTTSSSSEEVPRLAPNGLRMAGAVFAAAADDLGPVSGQVTIYNGDEALGAGTLNDTGNAVVEADTSELHPGSFNLRVAYSGDNTFAPTSVTLSLTVVLVASTPTIETTTVAAPALATTGFAATDGLGYAFLLVGAGFLLLLAATRATGRHRL